MYVQHFTHQLIDNLTKEIEDYLNQNDLKSEDLSLTYDPDKGRFLAILIASEIIDPSDAMPDANV